MLMWRPPRSRRVPLRGLALDEGLEALRYFRLVDSLKAVGGDGCDRRVDAADRIGSASSRVLVSGLVQTFDGELDGGCPVDAVLPAQLDGGAGVAAGRPGGVEVGLFVAAAGDVVLEDASGPAAEVIAGEDGDDDEALHGRRQVRADHLGKLVGLALEAQDAALDLLVVLELGLEET